MEQNILTGLLEQSGSIVPIVEGKRSIAGWNRFQTKPPSKRELNSWVESNGYEGYGLIMGYGGYQVIDIDQKNTPVDFTGSVFQALWQELPLDLRSRLLVQRTMNGGEHIVYRCPVSASARTLATNAETGKKVIETIGSRNYIKIYSDVPSGSWSSVPTLSKDEHELLIHRSQLVGERLFGSAEVSSATLEASTRKNKSNKRNGESNLQFISASAAEIVRSGIDITSDYNEWVQVGYAISNEIGEDGRQFFHMISSVNSAYNPIDTDAVYNSMLNGERKTGKVTGATLRHLMKKHKVPVPEEKGGIAQRTELAIAHIKVKGLMLNGFTNKVELNNGDLLTDRDVNDIYIELRKMNLSISKNDVAAIINSKEIETINPMRDWILKSEESANDQIIDEFLDCLKLKDTNPEMVRFIRSMVIKWMIQIPAMILDGVPPRLVLVAIGKTYIGKSELFRRMLPPQFQKYYAESGLDRDKDSEILMSEHLLVNVDELAGIMRSQKHVERFKSISSAQYFTLRTPYGKINERFQRKAILCGTANNSDIILDHDTGNTRIIPLELEDIDKDRYNAIDRDALFGSLTKMYREVGKKYLYLSEEEREMLQRKSDDHTVVNPEQEIILKYLRPCQAIESQFQTVSDISDYLIRHTSLQLDPRKISRELRNLGFIKARRRVNVGSSALNGFFVERIYADSDDVMGKLKQE